MPRAPVLAVVLLAACCAAGGPARAAAAPSPEDCIFYDAAFRAVQPLLAEAQRNTGYRRFAASSFGRPGAAAARSLSAGPSLSLRRCVALQQRVSAAGLDFVVRAPFSIRRLGSAPYEHFSVPARSGTVTHLSYYFSADDRLDLVLHQDPDGQWTVDGADHRLRIDLR
jgi:hypothetical protein